MQPLTIRPQTFVLFLKKMKRLRPFSLQKQITLANGDGSTGQQWTTRTTLPPA
jgi:hypothetical protein